MGWYTRWRKKAQAHEVMMDKKEIEREIAKVHWYHSIDLGGGIVTPGIAQNANGWKFLGLPDDLSGKTVLDIGAWDGFYSFEAERRGASRVLATDSFVWEGKTWGSKAGFDLARKLLDSKVEDRLIDVLELCPEEVGVFDVVLFLGVLYHMRHPLLALEKVCSVTRGLAVVESEVDMLDFPRPAMAFYPGRELANDPTSWVGPNLAGIEALLKAAGFRKTQLINKSPIFYRTPGVTEEKRESEAPMGSHPACRAVYHASK